MTPEGKVKKKLREAVKREGWGYLTPHWGKRGWPDVLILAPSGRVAFVEVKATGARHSREHLAKQQAVREHLRSLGHLAYLLVGCTRVEPLITELREQFERQNGAALIGEFAVLREDTSIVDLTFGKGVPQ